jgi:hypothetical protein
VPILCWVVVAGIFFITASSSLLVIDLFMFNLGRSCV